MASSRRARVLAPAIAAVTVGLFASLGPLGGYGGGGYFGVGYVVASLGVGLVLAWHVPRNPIGWLLMAIPGFVGAFQVCQDVGHLTFRHHPLVAVAAFAATQVFYFAFLFTAPVVLLLFPDGRLPSPRWRLVLRAYLALAGGVEVATIASVVAVATEAHLRWASNGTPVNGPPVGYGIAEGVLVAACLPLALSWVVCRIAGYRRTTGVIRQQFKWLALGACCLLAA
ncbi:MAG TPA: hypothetical protein VMD59_00040, partial [Acidimicrobiales bacterium]|nr:hypothetical protein [Acidimicrobiales bacterium]